MDKPTHTYIGIDPSWTGLAVTALEASGAALAIRGSEVLRTKPNDFESHTERLDAMSGKFDWLMLQFCGLSSAKGRFGPATVAIEGYSYGSQGRATVMMGELGAQLRLVLWRAGLSFIVVPPTVLKKFVTDKGSAKKEHMLLHTFKKWGYEAPNNDVCDAYCLAQLAYQSTLETRTKRVNALLAKCETVHGRGVRAPVVEQGLSLVGA